MHGEGARVIHNDNGVIHQHAHGDDETGKRGAVDALADKEHGKERSTDGKEQRRAYDNARAPTHNEHNQQDDYSHRLGEVCQEVVVRLARYLIFGI